MELRIKRGSNGVVLESMEEGADGEPFEQRLVYELESDYGNEEEEQKRTINVLYDIAEFLWFPMGNKHTPTRVGIHIEKQDG